MDQKQIEATAHALQQQWGLQLPDIISEELILAQLTKRVIRLLEEGPESFFQLMYRLDISEKKLNGVLHKQDVAAQIARLIYDRQLQKIQSRLAHSKEKQTEDPDLQW